MLDLMSRISDLCGLTEGQRARNVYVVFAMKRSGHHAVVHWICQQNGSIRHENNPFKQWEKKRIVANKSVDYGQNPRDLLINLEDFDLTDWAGYEFDRFPVIKGAERVYLVLLVREFRNWLASCLGRKDVDRERDRDVYEFLEVEHRNEHGDLKPPRIELYRQHLEEALSPRLFKDLIVIKYDEWFVSRQYRHELAETLGLEFTDAGKEDVTTFGYGSSFDQQTYDGRAGKMNVLSRWRTDISGPEIFEILDRNSDIENRSGELFDIDQSKCYLGVPNRILLAQKSPGFDEFCLIEPILQAAHAQFPQMEIHYDGTGLDNDEEKRLVDHCSSRHVGITVVKHPPLDAYRYYTGPLESAGKGGAVSLGKLAHTIRNRTGLNLKVDDAPGQYAGAEAPV